jgi:hypothetical protein
VLAILMFAVSGPVLYLHAMAWSEAPFFSFAIGALLALALRVTRNRQRDLILAAILVALAMLTRYVGLTLLAPLAFALIVLGRRSRRERIRDLAIAGAIATAPLGIWMIRNTSVGHHATDRTLAVHVVSAGQLLQLVTTLNDFLLPVGAGPWWRGTFVLVVALLLIAGLLAAHRSARAQRPAPPLGNVFALLCLVFAAGYLAFVLFTISFADATTPLDDRILFPVFGVVVIALVLLADTAARRRNHPAIWRAFAMCAALSIAVRLPLAIHGLDTMHRNGEGYTSVTWRNSEMLAQVRRLPSAIVVYSNAQDAIELLTGRSARWLPDSLIWENMQANPEFPRARDDMCREVASGSAVVAYFITDDLDNQGGIDQTADLCAFPLISRRADGVFYSANPVDVD